MTNEIIELNRCSIGVTTGSVYVGVIGHEERHEYSFLGPKVCEQFYFRWLKYKVLGEYGCPYHDGRLSWNGEL